jgi:hypothetical protein
VVVSAKGVVVLVTKGVVVSAKGVVVFTTKE